MRSRNGAPADRANSHASAAVRRLPTCSDPVGLGGEPAGAGPTCGPSARDASGHPAGALRSFHTCSDGNRCAQSAVT